MSRFRVLIVDDSAFARKTLRTVLASSPYLEVVGTARDGLEALEKIAELKPDVVTLDLVMPNLDGIGLLQSLPRDSGVRVVIVSVSGASSELAIAALQLGAVDLVRKPTALATDQLYLLNDELIAKVLAAARARPAVQGPISPVVLAAPKAGNTRLVVVGASTGGPSAVTRLLRALPGNFPVPIVVALHIPPGYTDALAARLDEQCELDVREASEGLTLRPGLAVLAKGGEHIAVRKHGSELRVHLSPEPLTALYFPSIDLLFESAARELKGSVVGIVLTGMGSDGCKGSGLIRAQGGQVLTEAESSCVIYGMPRSVVEAGFSSRVATLDALPALLLASL